jgi:predicted RNase H-like HicB family nuclease
MADYLALLRAANGSGYSVRFPDFPAISVVGDSMDEARDAARDALAAHIGFMLDEELGIPEPSPLEVIMADRRNRDAVALLISAPPVGKPVRIAANVDELLVREIDALAVGQGIGRGDVISAALRQYIATARQTSKITAEVKAMKRSGRRR